MPIPIEQSEALCLRWANNDQLAAKFLLNVMHMTRLADDIADGDSGDPVRAMANLLIRAWVDHARNPFFQKHQQQLSAVMANAVLLWEKSEDWRTDDNRKTRHVRLRRARGYRTCRLYRGVDHRRL